MPLAVLTIAIAALAADAYTPPRQTPTQMAKMQAWSREAEKLSAAATPALLAKLGSADFRRALGECCPVAATSARLPPPREPVSLRMLFSCPTVARSSDI